MTHATVGVKSSLASKINWTALSGAIVAVIAAFGIDLSDEVRTNILTSIPIVGGVVIWILRTWFTKSLTKGSVG